MCHLEHLIINDIKTYHLFSSTYKMDQMLFPSAYHNNDEMEGCKALEIFLYKAKTNWDRGCFKGMKGVSDYSH